METKRKINPNKEFYNPEMYNRFTKESNPSVCVTGKLNISKLMKFKKHGYKLNALLCYCIQQAAQKIEAFHYSIKEDGLYYYQNVKTNSVVFGKDGKHYYPDYSYHANFNDFYNEYNKNNAYCYENCKHYIVDAGAIIATSAVVNYSFESFSLGVSETFWDNFLMWGKYFKSGFKTYLNMSLRFHHALIDGKTAGDFFNELQKQINIFKPNL